jgi:hypothetical protein
MLALLVLVTKDCGVAGQQQARSWQRPEEKVGTLGKERLVVGGPEELRAGF